MMQAVSLKNQPFQSRHLIEDQPHVLYQVQRPDIDLSLWRRPIHRALAGEVSVLQPNALPDLKRFVSVADFDDEVAEWIDSNGLPVQEFQYLRRDLGELAKVFATIAETDALAFRLFTTDQDDCKRFHLDRMRLRLICTYQGAGTEWLTEAQVDREAQHNYAANEDIIRFGEPQQFEPFWVGILRGDPGNLGKGQVHRSPSVADTGITRVVFCLDA